MNSSTRAKEHPTHQQEVDAPQHRVLQVVRAPVVLKLDVQAVLDAHLHLWGQWSGSR